MRADDETLGLLGDDALAGGWRVAHAEPSEGETEGRAGVAIATRLDVLTEAAPGGVLTVVATYG